MAEPLPVDVAIVELHRLRSTSERITSVVGRAHRLNDDGEPIGLLRDGSELRIGETIALEPGTRLIVAGMELTGGKRGRAHAFVADSAFRSAPTRADVPKLLEQLAQIERQLARIGDDPLALQRGPTTTLERAMASDFVRQNLVLEVARSLDEGVARKTRSVCLFFSDDAAFIAMSAMSLAKVRMLMEALGRPVNPHLVDDAVIEELLAKVYARLREPGLLS
jgi:hypothetical protein